MLFDINGLYTQSRVTLKKTYEYDMNQFLYEEVKQVIHGKQYKLAIY